MVNVQQEREDKFDVEPGFVLPDLSDLLPENGRLETPTYELENTYFDTADEMLRKHGMTLRRRRGGRDAGWHLKVPAGRAKTEIRSSYRGSAVPRALADIVFGVRRGQDLAPVATVSTRRDITRLLDADGEQLVEVAQDDVHAATMGAEATLRHWQEVEVELGAAGDERLLEAIAERLLASGAQRSPWTSKLSRALGAEPHLRQPLDRQSLGGLLAEYLTEQVTAIVDGDCGLRMDRPVVHPTRVAVRRLRSTLRIFGPAFDADRAARLDEELVWFAGLLGPVRDGDILRDRLLASVADLPSEFVLGPVASHIETTLLLERTTHLKQVKAALRGERYLRLLDELDQWRTAPPFTDVATEAAAQVSTYVAKAQRKLKRRLRSAGDDPEALHRARKAGKRFRYAAELSLPVVGKTASKAVKQGKKLQKLLGDHQDAVVSARFLRTLGASSGTADGHNGFTYGLLLAQEWQRARDIRTKLRHRYT